MTYPNDFRTFARKHIEEKRLEPLKNRLSKMRVEELIDALQELRDEDQAVVFRLLPKPVAVDVFDAMDIVWRREMIESFSNEEAINLLGTLEPEDRVHLLDELPARVAKQLLASLPKEQREVTALLMGYESGTVGRIMSPDFVDVKGTMTVAEALDRIRTKKNGGHITFHHVYVTDDTRKLLGVLPLSALVTATPGCSIAELVGPEEPPFARTREDQELAARRLEQLDAPELPVVDREHRLVGVFTANEAIDVLQTEVTDDMYDKVGLLDVTQRETDRSARLLRGSFWHVLAVRVPFLLITLAGGMLAGFVIDQFEDILVTVAATAIFIPVIMDMGGNVGTQSSTIFTRGTVLGQINMRRFAWHWGREVLYGFGMAVLFGVLGGVVAHVWQGVPGLGIAVGISLTLTITVATAMGFLVPYVLIRLGFDQAAGADPFITTIKDMTGLAIYFASVSFLVPHIVLGG